MTRLPTGSLVVAVAKDASPQWEAKFRWDQRQVKRRLGPAWLRSSGDDWIKRAGRPQEGFLSREDAIVAMRSVIAAHAAEKAQESAQTVPTFGQAAERWFERAQRRGLKPFTLKLYRQLLDAYVLDKAVYKSSKIPRRCPFADHPIDKISKDDMRQWFDPLSWSPQKAKVFMVVKSVCAFAVGEGWLRENPATAVECRAPKASADYEFFERAEINRLIAAAADEHDAALFATAAFSGLRKGELFGLRWSDIDFEGRRIVVKRNLTLGQIGTPKNGYSRVVPLIPELAERLKAFKRHSPPSASVFSGHPDVVVKRYREALKRAGLRPLPFHSLRHSFGSAAVNVATLVAVRDWMGHTDLRVTGRYLHAKSLVTDADLLGRAF